MAVPFVSFPILFYWRFRFFSKCIIRSIFQRNGFQPSGSKVLTTSMRADLISYTHTFEQELPNPWTMTFVGADTLNALPAQCQMDVMFVNATSSNGVSRRLLRELYNKNLVFTWKMRTRWWTTDDTAVTGAPGGNHVHLNGPKGPHLDIWHLRAIKKCYPTGGNDIKVLLFFYRFRNVERSNLLPPP